MISRFRLFGRKTAATVPVPELSAFPRKSGKLEPLVMQEYRNAGLAGLTADECALRLGRGILSVRPTVTHLFQQGSLRRTGQKRLNESGLKANVLVLASLGCPR